MTEPSPVFKADGLPTLIGSLPLNDYQKALEWIFSSTPQIPLWPQLPANPLERMLNQFNEGLPGIVEEEDKNRILEQFVFYNCEGRLNDDYGCDWSLGGLFKNHTTEVISPEGLINPVFEFAKPLNKSLETNE